MIDGRNLALEKGTGVATYARTLSFCLHSLGYSVNILYGKRIPKNSSSLLGEVLFYDEIPEKMRVL